MTIHTRNEVLVTCQDTPLMELLEHLVKDHAPDLDYCLENLGLDYTVASEPREVRTQQEFLDLPIGTVVNTEDDETLYKIGEGEWTEARYLGNTFFRVIRSTDRLSESAAHVVFTPEVQA